MAGFVLRFRARPSSRFFRCEAPRPHRPFRRVRTCCLELEARLRQVVAAESAAELSWIRYEDGIASYLEVLETQRALFNAQIATSQTRQLALASVVDLYAALGGGWQVLEVPAPAREEP